MTSQYLQQIANVMASPEFYPHKTCDIRRKDTHISTVFLTGDFVYKIKKDINLGFLDFSTLEKRRHFCCRETILNRRLAPDIYTDVVSINLENGHYVMGGRGEVVEYAVRMRQLDDLLDMKTMIRAGGISRVDMICLGSILNQFYINAPVSEQLTAERAWQNIYTACQENFSHTKPFCGSLLDRQAWETVQGATLSFLKKRKPWFFERFESGLIRDCHGDLRCGHIYFTDKGIQIIDCIEFNDDLRNIDIISDLAFLLMDLDFMEKPGYGQCLLNEFLRHTGDLNAFRMLLFYKSYRAFVRCKVNCLFLKGDKSLTHTQRKRIHLDALRYLDLAGQYALQYFRPIVWVVCGMPGTGKSTIAKELSRILDIKLFRSDVERKKLFGLAPHESGTQLFGDKIYSPLAGSLTYGKLLCLADQEIQKGESVILDATYSTHKSRSQVVDMAKDKGINPIFIECSAPADILKRRLLARESRPSASDARLAQFQDLTSRYERFRHAGCARFIRADTEKPLETTIRHIFTTAFQTEANHMIDISGTSKKTSTRTG